MAELDFVPNRAARGLITGQTGNVAVIVPDLTNPHFAALVQAAGRRRGGRAPAPAGRHGRARRRGGPGRPHLAHEVDGFVVLSPRRLHKELAVLGSTPRCS